MSNQHKPPTTTSSYYPPTLNYHPMQYYLNGPALQNGQPGPQDYPGMSLFNSVAGSSNVLHPANYAGNAMYTSALANAVPHRFPFAHQNNQDLSKIMAANEQAKMYNTAMASNTAYLYNDNSQKGNSRPSSPANGGSFKTKPSAQSRNNTPGLVQTNAPSRNNTPGAYSYFGETQVSGEPMDLRLENFNCQNFQSKNLPPTKFTGTKKEADGASTNVSGLREIRPHPERGENPATNPSNQNTPLMLNSLSQDLSKTSASYGADYYKMLSAYPYLPYMMNSQALAPNTASPYAWPLPALASMSGYYPQLSSQSANLLQLPMGQFALNTPQPGFMPQNIWNPMLAQVNSGQTSRAVSPARVEAPQMYGQNNGGSQYLNSAQNSHLMSALASHQLTRSSTPKDSGQSAKSTRLDTAQEPAGNQSPKSTPKRARAMNARSNKRAAKNLNGDKDLTPSKVRKRKVAEIEPTFSQAKQQNSASQQSQYGSQNYFQNPGTVGPNITSHSGNVQQMDNLPLATADDSVDYLDSDESIDFSSTNKLNHRQLVVNGQVRNQTPNEKQSNENAKLASDNTKTYSQNATGVDFSNPHVMTSSAPDGLVYQESEKFNEQEAVEQSLYQNRTNSLECESGNLIIDDTYPGSPPSEDNYHVPEPTCETDNYLLPLHPSGTDNYHLSGPPCDADNYHLTGAVTISSEYYEPPKLLDKDYNIVDITVSKCTDTHIDSSNTESSKINTNIEENHVEYNQRVNQVSGISETSHTTVNSNALVCESETANKEETKPDRSNEVHQHEGRGNSYHPLFYVETNFTENPSFEQPNRVDSPEEIEVYPTKNNQEGVKDVHGYDTLGSSRSHSPQDSDTKNIQHSTESQNILHSTETHQTPHNTETQNEHHTTCHEPAPENSYSSQQPQGDVSQSAYRFNSPTQDSQPNLNSSPIGNSSMPDIPRAEPTSTQGQSRLFGFDIRRNHQDANQTLENSSQFQHNGGRHGQKPEENAQQFSHTHNHGAMNLALENTDKQTISKKLLPHPSTDMNYPAWYGNSGRLENLSGGPVPPANNAQPQPLTDKTNTPEPQNDATYWKHPVAPYMPYPMFNGRNFDLNTNYNHLGGNQLQNSYSHYLDYYNKENIEKNVVDSLTVMEKNKAHMSCSNVLVDKNVVVCQSKLSCSSYPDQTNTVDGHYSCPELDCATVISQQTNPVGDQQVKVDDKCSHVVASGILSTESDLKTGPDDKIGPDAKNGSDANIKTCLNQINIKQEIMNCDYSTSLDGAENFPKTCDENSNPLNLLNTKHQKSLVSFYGNVSRVKNTRPQVKENDEHFIKQECVSNKKPPVAPAVHIKQTNILTFFSSNAKKNHLADRLEPTSTRALLLKSEQQQASLESSKVLPFKEKNFSNNKIHSQVESKPVLLADKGKVRSYSQTNHSLVTGNYSTASRGKQMLMKSREKNLENKVSFPEDLSVFKMPIVGATGIKAQGLKKLHQPAKHNSLKKCSHSVIKCDSQLYTVGWMYGFIEVLNLTEVPASQMVRINSSIGTLQDLCPLASLEELGFYTNPMCRGLYFIIKVEDWIIPLRPLIRQFLTGRLRPKKAPTNPTAFNIVGTSSGLDLRKASQGSARTSEYAKLRQNMSRSYCDACGNAYSCSTEQHLNGDKHKAVVNTPGFYHSLDALMNLTGSIHVFVNFHLGNKAGDIEFGDGKVADNKVCDDKAADDNIGDDKVADNKVCDDKVGDDKAADDNIGDDKAGDEKVGDNITDKVGQDKLADNKLSEKTELASTSQCIGQQEMCIAGTNSPQCKLVTTDITVNINLTQTIKSDMILQAPKLNLLNTKVVYRKRTYSDISKLTSDQHRTDQKSKKICCRVPSDQDPSFKLAQDIENISISPCTNTLQDNFCADKNLSFACKDIGHNNADFKWEATQLKKVAHRKIKLGKISKLRKKKESSNPVTYVLINNNVALDQWSEARDKNIFLQCLEELKEGSQPTIFQYTY